MKRNGNKPRHEIQAQRSKIRISFGYLGAHQSRAWTNAAALALHRLCTGSAQTSPRPRWPQAVSPEPQVASSGVTKAAARFGFPEHADSTARVPRNRRKAARGPRCTWLAVDASTAAWAASTQDTRDGRHQARMTDNAACPSSRSAVSSLAPSAPRDRWSSCSGGVFEPRRPCGRTRAQH